MASTVEEEEFTGYDIACACLVLGIGIFVSFAIGFGLIWIVGA